MTATDILNHCKAVCEGRIPQPLPKTIKKTSETCYSLYDSQGDLIDNIHKYEAEMPRSFKTFAKLLGLDKPEIVLEWKHDADGEVAALNGYLNAATWHFPKHTKARIYLRNIVLMELDFRGDDRKEKAREWCEQMLKAITTQTPRT